MNSHQIECLHMVRPRSHVTVLHLLISDLWLANMESCMTFDGSDDFGMMKYRM